jgi:hypothetical protein
MVEVGDRDWNAGKRGQGDGAFKSRPGNENIGARAVMEATIKPPQLEHSIVTAERASSVHLSQRTAIARN